MKRSATAAMLGIAIAFLACGCLWGHVYDSETGLEVPGATVSWVDGHGRSASMTTGLWWAPGLFAFCYESYTAPYYNPVTFTVTAPGYMPLVAQRQIAYDDGPYTGEGWPSCDDTWEVQDFSLMPLPGTSALPPQPSPSPTPSHTPPPPPTPTRGLIPIPRILPTATPVLPR